MSLLMQRPAKRRLSLIEQALDFHVDLPCEAEKCNFARKQQHKGSTLLIQSCGHRVIICDVATYRLSWIMEPHCPECGERVTYRMEAV